MTDPLAWLTELEGVRSAYAGTRDGIDVMLRERVPEVSARTATAEDIPANDRSVDAVVVAQAFHWFDHDVALPEIARVLKPGGHLALVWNSRDERIPWVRRMGDLLGRQELDTSSAERLVLSGLFGFVEETTFKHWQEVNRETIIDLARSRSSFAMMDDAEQEDHLEQVRAFYEDYGRGMDGMQIPYVTRCYRAVVVDRDEQATSDPDGPSQEGPVVSDGGDTDMLLIDFR